jgi:regulatory protein
MRPTNKSGPTLRERALGYLARREYSRQELHRKLEPYAREGDDLDALLEDFLRHGWLSDQRFAEQFVHARKNRYGRLKVVHELRRKGVPEAVADEAVSGLNDLEAASIVWQKKFGRVPESQEEWVRQARFLQSRGFGFEEIRKVLQRNFDEIS